MMVETMLRVPMMMVTMAMMLMVMGVVPMISERAARLSMPVPMTRMASATE